MIFLLVVELFDLVGVLFVYFKEQLRGDLLAFLLDLLSVRLEFF